MASKSVDSFFGGTGATGGLFSNTTGAGGVAVRESTGDVYVADRGNHRVEQFDAAGNFVRAWGTDVDMPAGGTNFEICTVAANCKAGVSTASTGGAMSTPQGVAVNQTTGDVYVTDQGFLRVDQFSATGTWIRSWGQDVSSAVGTGFEVCSTASQCKTGTTGGIAGAFASTFSGYPAVAPAGGPNPGNVIVADPGNARVQEFTSSGVFVRAIGYDVVATGSGQAGSPEVQTIAVNATGGTFTLTFNSQTTGALAFNVPASGGVGATASIENALNALSSVGGVGGSVSVTGSNPYTVTFGGSLSSRNVGQITATTGSATANTVSNPPGTVLTCTASTGDSQSYRWLRNGADIAGATASTYTTTAADNGAAIQCQGFAAWNGATAGGSTQVGIPAIIASPFPATAPPVPPNIAAPTLAGTVNVGGAGGATLTCNPGSWTGSPTFAYQWYRNGIALSGNGATTNIYTVQTADLATRASFQCRVTGTNAGGSVARVSSNLSTNPIPSPTATPPTITTTVSPLPVVTTTTTNGVPAFETCTAASGAVCQNGVSGNDLGQFASSEPKRVAADSAGAIYSVESSANFRVQKLTTDVLGGVTPTDFTGVSSSATPGTGNTPTDVSVDPKSGPDQNDDRILVVKAVANGTGAPPATAAERRVFEYDQSGSLLDTHMVNTTTIFNPAISSVNGLAVRTSPSRAYVSSTTVAQRVYMLDDDGTASATMTLNAVTDIGTHTATFSGSVNPNGTPTGYRIEYAKQGSDDWTRVPATDIDLGSGSTAVDVGPTTVTNLEANQAYKVRLATSKAFNPGVFTPEQTFTTSAAAPEVALNPATKIKARSATLNATINPNNQATTWYFEYGTDASYGAKIPLDGVTAGGSGLTVPVWRVVRGLEPATVYHFRLVATSLGGTTESGDQTFVTPPLGAAPAGRGAEMVTPPEKPNRRGATEGEGNPELSGGAGTPSPDGDSILLSNFAGALTDQGQGNAAVDPTRFVRRAGGWQAQPVFSQPLLGSTYLGLHFFSGASEDQSLQALRVPAKTPIFDEQRSWPTVTAGNGVNYTRFFDNSPSWAQAPGWGNWYTSSSFLSPDGSSAPSALRALFSNDGRDEYMTAIKGMLGPSDPAIAPGGSGGAVYHQDLASGAFDVVSACADGTRLPARSGTSDTVDTQACADGTVTSVHGATVGAGELWDGTQSAQGVLYGPAATSVSDDGDTVFFTSPDPGSTQVVPSVQGCTTATGSASRCQPQLFVSRRDSSGDRRVRWISRPAIAGQEVGLLGRGAAFEGASRDGRRVFFRTNAPLTADDPNGGTSNTAGTASPNSWDLYEYRLPADPDADPADGTLTRISAGPNGTADPNTNCSQIGTGGQAGNCNVAGTAGQAAGAGNALRYLSDDGRRVYFVTASPIAGADNAPPAGGTTTAGGSAVNASTRNLYLYDSEKSGAARWKFIARLPYSNTTLAGCASAYPGWGSPLSILTPADGRGPLQRFAGCVRGAQQGEASNDVLTFMTAGQLTADDTDGALDVYIYDSAEDRLVRASGGGTGAAYGCVNFSPTQVPQNCNADFATSLGDVLEGLSRGPTGLRHLNVTTDGAVFFESRRRLVPEDTNGSRMDVYQWKDGELSLLSPGTSDDEAYFSGNSDDGRDVFITTTAPLDPYREVDADFDTYDLRRGGGFPPPTKAERCEVMADRCQAQGVTAVAPAVETASPGTGNVPASVRGEFSVKKLSGSQVAALIAGRSVNLGVKVNLPGRVAATGEARIAKKPRRVLSSSRAASAAGTVSVPIKLSSAARDELKTARKLRVTLTVTFSNAREPLATTMTLKQPRASTRKTPTRRRAPKTTRGGAR